jgi:hypothetical protein
MTGTKGDVQVSGANGHAQTAQLTLTGARGEERTLQPIEVPPSYYANLPDGVLARNVARMHARMAADLRDGTRTAPNFEDTLVLVCTQTKLALPFSRSVVCL